MKMKLTSLMFGLLLAVGWTSSAFAQSTTFTAESIKGLTYDWEDANGNTQTSHYVELNAETGKYYAPEVSNPYQIYGLLRGVYMEKELPGPTYSAYKADGTTRERKVYYGGVRGGWDIPGNVSSAITSQVGAVTITVSRRVYIEYIKIVSGTKVLSSWDYATNGSSLPWNYSGTASYDTDGWLYFGTYGGGTITIPASITNGYESVEVQIRATYATGYTGTITVFNQSKTIDAIGKYNWNKNAGLNTFADNTYAPKDEGYTALVVALKNTAYLAPEPSFTQGSTYYQSKDSVINYIAKNIQFVKLLTDGLRITDAGGNPGTVFNCDGTYNKFFFLSKGKARQKGAEVQANIDNGTWPYYSGECAIFWPMYEEFSPQSAKLVGGSTTVDFFDRMNEGSIYDVVHDCAGVIQNRHEFSLAGEDKDDDFPFTGMNFFIPDFRLKYWEGKDSIQYTDGTPTEYVKVDGRDMNALYKTDGTSFRGLLYYYANFAQYNPDYAPKVGIYKIALSATATFVGDAENPDHSPNNLNYVVTLQWVSSLNTMSGTTVPQTYTIYCYDNVTGEKFELEATGVTNPTGQTTVSYLVPQREHSYTIEYIVMGTPDDSEHPNFVAWSNRDFVVIPGWDDFVGLQLDHHESDFVANKMANYYRNFLEVVNEDVFNGLTVAEITGGNEQAPMNEFILYRFLYDKNNKPIEPSTPIAKVKFGTPTDEGVPYTVTYLNDQDVLETPKYDLDEEHLNVPLTGFVRIKGNGDLVIWPNSYHVNFKSIKVYNGNTLLTSWDYTQDNLPNGWIVSPGSEWEVYINTTNNDKVGYMEGGGYIAIPNIMNNSSYTDLRVEIVAYGDGASVPRINVNDYTQTITNGTSATYKWGGSGADDVPISPYAAPKHDNTNNNSNN